MEWRLWRGLSWPARFPRCLSPSPSRLLFLSGPSSLSSPWGSIHKRRPHRGGQRLKHCLTDGTDKLDVMRTKGKGSKKSKNSANVIHGRSRFQGPLYLPISSSNVASIDLDDTRSPPRCCHDGFCILEFKTWRGARIKHASSFKKKSSYHCPASSPLAREIQSGAGGHLPSSFSPVQGVAISHFCLPLPAEFSQPCAYFSGDTSTSYSSVEGQMAGLFFLVWLEPN